MGVADKALMGQLPIHLGSLGHQYLEGNESEPQMGQKRR